MLINNESLYNEKYPRSKRSIREVCLEECKYVVKERKVLKCMLKCITDDIESSPNGSDKKDSDKEQCEEHLDEESSNQKSKLHKILVLAQFQAMFLV